MRFRIGHTKVNISFLFFSMLTMIFAIDEKGVALITMISVALHEIGHISALFLLGSRPDEIDFGIFGIRIRQNKYMLSDVGQIMVVAFGPLVNFVLFAVVLVAYLIFESQILLIISAVNIVVGGFNLMPIFPLDGGRILFVILSLFLRKRTVMIIMRLICIVCIFALIILGVFIVRNTGWNFSLLATVGYLAVLCTKSVRI